ncbi:hypothetical protein [Paenibacillus tyrfis]|uniref:Lipoprotein n=1 Tax=Paenibacillus tyrfis TaxID=1501230 RepID=A0A081P6N6_9BACL|nr:hypothetical protein [Paenibacillus tyrfis]KEQ26359.1 hypothetical protein ET33_31320 [Paenibacillus tyrfis]
MQKKIVSAVVGTAMVCSFAGSAFANAAPSNAPVSTSVPLGGKITPTDGTNEQSKYPTVTVASNQLTKDIIAAGNSITQYIKLGQDNLFHLDPTAKALFSSEVYQAYSNSVDSVNQGLQQKLLKIENGKPVANASSFANSGGGVIQTIMQILIGGELR